MPQIFVHKLSPELTGDAQYKNISDISTAALTAGSTLQLFPGTYTLNQALDNVTLMGIGEREQVIIHAPVLASGSANTVIFENLTLRGNVANAAASSAALIIAGDTTSVATKFREVVFTNAAVGVLNYGTGAITMTECDATGVDKAVVANSAATFRFCMLNSSSNAYFQSGNTTIKAATVFVSRSGGSNGTFTTETVQAAIS